MKNYNIVVIGAGPGGYMAAIRAAQLEKSVAIVEKDDIGGVCLNVGCIPSKSLLRYSEMMQNIQQANEWGIATGKPEVNYAKLTERTQKVVQTLTNGVSSLLKKNSVAVYKGEATVSKDRTITIGEEKIRAEDILLATGSKPFVPPIKGLDQVSYETTDSFFDRKERPEKLAVIGGGVIAAELASSIALLGTDVTIIEVAPDVLLTEEKDVRRKLKEQLQDQGVRIYTKAEIEEVQKDKVVLSSPEEEVSFDTLLVAAGRKPNLDMATELDLKCDEQSKCISVDENFQTSQKHIYAVGDLIGGYQLAHAASAEGLVAVADMAGKKQRLSQNEIPRCIYTHLEAASFGMTEEEANEAGYETAVTKSTLNGNSKALVDGEPDGFMKIVSEQKYNEILGAFVVGPNATELIGQLLGVKSAEGTMHELAAVVQPHPALSEAIGEGSQAFFNQAIHM